MLEIEIDISGPVQELQLLSKDSKKLGSAILDRIIDEYMQRWETEVSNNLKRTKSEYLRAINVERGTDNSVAIQLLHTQSDLPIKLEEGAEPWDIKPLLKGGKSVKQSLGGGWYVDVPFRFTTGGALRTPGFSAVASASVIKIAKQKAPRAVQTLDLPKKLQGAGIRDVIVKNKTVIPHYQHKVSIYAGLKRREVGVKGRKSGAYSTFRRVSDNSDSLAFIHKGFHARKFMDRVTDSLEWGNIVEFVINDFLSNK